MKKIIEDFKITDTEHFSLKKYDTGYTADYKKEDADLILQGLITEISELQEKLYACNHYALLIIFQAMDAAGKDSAIAHTMSGLNPQGCQVYSFKQPSTEEYDHDFLWRHYKALPERGRIGIHNRSHYENVLVTKVHPEYVLKENIPGIGKVEDIDESFWKHRYKSIKSFEKHLTRNGTVIIKFFLHVSKEEQKERFLQRLEKPDKNWKFSAADIAEREHWNEYMDAYEQAIKETSTDNAPWYVLPADKKWFTRIAISHVVLETLKGLDLRNPRVPADQKAKFDEIRKQLENEK
ncbi:polyphosphate kinase 2 family protein [Mucilaginibacter sp. KACC 22063]|uniref:polyphosphate kinase 2 family protein n=1 Tax=Mucilaginibacter sp. KACC 22063 TaxID=3025666 RepID=UPI0023656B7A|nr:polyphosphate kinase 2 family protein [Mucilaginibacter sp. KACC 22063]WDF53423.1 polyphosphate kinase 2 family protein [Mucilaginibacter sp. KACC 22063]